MKRRFLPAAALLLLSQSAHAELRLGDLFSDNAVLQRGRPIAVWGQAEPGQRVRVTLDQSAREAIAGKDGRWRVELPARPPGGPYALTASTGSATAIARDILIGDVWLCSGQSNMEWPLRSALGGANDTQEANDAQLRLLTVAKKTATDARVRFDETPAWATATPEAAGDFSAVCYHMGRELRASQQVPIGLIDASWGGTQIRAWMDPEAVRAIGGADAGLLDLYRRDPAAANARFAEMWESWWRDRTGVAAGKEPWGDAGGDLEWAPVPQIALWERWGDPRFAEYNGTVWMRTRFTLTPAEAAQGGTLSLGVIDELDQTWVNGAGVGSTYSWTEPRGYRIARGVLRAGENNVTVNVFDSSGGGGMAGPAETLTLTLADGTVKSLDTGWRYSVAPSGLTDPPRPPWDNSAGPSLIYNGMVAPLHDYGLSGVAWYQGESDVQAGGSYADRLTAMMRGWRRQFGQADLPFQIVSLANYGPFATEPVASGWAKLRDEQRLAAARDPHAALVVAMDLGERTDIHPANKKEVGRRLARAARFLVYGGREPVGPEIVGAKRAGGDVVLAFRGVTGALRNWSGANALAFELCAETQPSCRFAEATAAGSTVRIRDDGRPATRVRYAWADSPVTNLYDEAPLPVGPFEVPIAQ